MLRRTLLLSSAAAFCAQTGRAATQCSPTICETSLSFRRFAARYEPQYQSQWCWAACISMVFGHYGYRVAQERIVTEAYGAPVDMPAVNGFVIASALNRVWIDDRGREFEASLEAVFDVMAGYSTLDNIGIVDALDEGNPIIVGARGHAVVMTSVQYINTPVGPNIVRVGVFDPWPGRGPRWLAPDEMVPVPRGSLTFLAQTSVS